MRFNLTQASHRVMERASTLRLHHGVGIISSGTLLWSLFAEEECRAAHWLQEADLSLGQFLSAFGIALLDSPITAPPFAAGSYGVSPGQYTPPQPPSSDLKPTQTDGHSTAGSRLLHDQSTEGETPAEQEPNEHEQPQDVWEPTKSPPFSLYTNRQQTARQGQARLHFFLDDLRVHIGQLTQELENNLETAALRLLRQDRQQPIAVGDGLKPITFNMPAFSLTTEHLFLAVSLDNGDVGRWLSENGMDSTEIYQRIDIPNVVPVAEAGGMESDLLADTVPALTTNPLEQCSESSFYRLVDALGNRGREAVRVIEDYVRFLLDDAELTQRLKTFRHQFQDILLQFPLQDCVESRDTEQDVGTTLSTDGEYHRQTLTDILSANFSRLQESLRSLEEFSKLFDTKTARQFEQLRYRCYTLQKDVLSRGLGQSPSSG